MGWIQGSLLVLLASGLVVSGLSIARARGFRRRLLLILAAASLLPATGVATVMVVSSRSMLGMLDGPGLQETVDGGLGLGRELISREERALHEFALRVSEDLRAGREPQAPVGFGWSADGGRGSGESTRPFVDMTARFGPRLGDPPRRVRVRGATALVMQRHDPTSRSTTDSTADDSTAEPTLHFVRVLPLELAADLDRIERGSQGLRQLDLYYRPLLTTGLLVTAALAVLAIAALGGILGRDISGRLVRPLADLVEGTRRVADGDLQTRVETRAVGEVAELVDAFNGMTLRLAESEARLRRSERLAAWQGIARRLAHEIKNPLTPIQLAVHRMRRHDPSAVVDESLRAIEEETANLQRLAEEFSTLGRLPEPRLEPVELSRVAAAVIELYVPDSIVVRQQTAGVGELLADEGQLRQVLSNLVKNAVQAMGSTGELELRARSNGGTVTLEVIDDGPGLGAHADRVFDPEFTTRATGTGLGLAIVQRIVEDHGGSIQAMSRPAGGACFTVVWPRATTSVTKDEV